MVRYSPDQCLNLGNVFISQVDEAEKLLNSWTITVENMYISYDNLLFFSFSKVLSLYTILTAQIFSADEMIQEVGFLFDNDSKAIRELQIVVKVNN